MVASLRTTPGGRRGEGVAATEGCDEGDGGVGGRGGGGSAAGGEVELGRGRGAGVAAGYGEGAGGVCGGRGGECGGSRAVAGGSCGVELDCRSGDGFGAGESTVPEMVTPVGGTGGTGGSGETGAMVPLPQPARSSARRRGLGRRVPGDLRRFASGDGQGARSGASSGSSVFRTAGESSAMGQGSPGTGLGARRRFPGGRWAQHLPRGQATPALLQRPGAEVLRHVHCEAEVTLVARRKRRGYGVSEGPTQTQPGLVRVGGGLVPAVWLRMALLLLIGPRRSWPCP